MLQNNLDSTSILCIHMYNLNLYTYLKLANERHQISREEQLVTASFWTGSFSDLKRERDIIHSVYILIVQHLHISLSATEHYL